MSPEEFPHPTCMEPGPATTALRPAEYVGASLAHLPEDRLRKVVRENTATIYHVS